MEEGQEWREGDKLTTAPHTDRNKEVKGKDIL